MLSGFLVLADPSGDSFLEGGDSIYSNVPLNGKENGTTWLCMPNWTIPPSGVQGGYPFLRFFVFLIFGNFVFFVCVFAFAVHVVFLACEWFWAKKFPQFFSKIPEFFPLF